MVAGWQCAAMSDRPITADRLARVPFLAALPPAALARLATVTEELDLPAGSVLLQQYARVEVVHVLVSGTVQILLRFGAGQELLVSVLREPGALIGWSAFRAPYRATATVRCEEPVRVLAIPAAALEALAAEDPALAVELLRRVAAIVADRFQATRGRLAALERGPAGRGGSDR
jgi:CRP-like cAMP-binding protein